MGLDEDVVKVEWRGKVSAHVVQWMRRLSAVVVAEDETTILGAL